MLSLKPTYLLARICFASSLITILFFSACDDAEEEPEVIDTTKPSLSFESPVANAVLKNDITIEVKASDDKAVSKVEFFIDGVLFHSFVTTPYAAVWNTKDVTDGVHVIKAVATDDAGNQQSIEMSVTVKNKFVLLTIEVPEDFYETGEVSNKWIVLHDSDWNILTAGRLKPGKTLELIAPPGFTDEKFNVTEIGILDKGPEPFVHAYSYMEVKKGKWVASDEPSLINKVSTVNLSFKNPDATTVYRASTNGGLYGDLSRTNAGANALGERVISTTIVPSKLFVREINKETNKFFMNTDFAGPNYTQDLASVTNSSADNIIENVTLDVEASESYAYVYYYGLTAENNFDQAYFLGMFWKEDDKITVERPKASTNPFVQYAANVTMLTESFFATNFLFDEVDATPLSVQYALNDLSTTSARLTASGEFDVFTSYFFPETILENYFAISGPAVTNQEIKIPALPDSVIADFDFVDLSTLPISPSLYFTDVVKADNYSDLILKLKQENTLNPGTIFYEHRSLYTTDDDSGDGGRKRNNKDEIRNLPQLVAGRGDLRYIFKQQ